MTATTARPDRTPNCPLCGKPPRMRMTVQCFCGTAGCPVITWDSRDSAEEFRRTASLLDLTALDPPTDPTPTG